MHYPVVRVVVGVIAEVVVEQHEAQVALHGVLIAEQLGGQLLDVDDLFAIDPLEDAVDAGVLLHGGDAAHREVEARKDEEREAHEVRHPLGGEAGGEEHEDHRLGGAVEACKEEDDGADDAGDYPLVVASDGFAVLEPEGLGLPPGVRDLVRVLKPGGLVLLRNAYGLGDQEDESDGRYEEQGDDYDGPFEEEGVGGLPLVGQTWQQFRFVLSAHGFSSEQR